MAVLTQLKLICVTVIGFSALAGCIQLEEFYPFGEAAGDQELARGDDGFSDPLQLEKRFPYYDQEESTLYVSGFTTYNIDTRAASVLGMNIFLTFGCRMHKLDNTCHEALVVS